MKRNSQYALYKGEKLVGIGTKKELAKLLKVRVETITFYTTPTHRKRCKNGYCVVKIEEEKMKGEIKHFKSLLRQGSLRNMNILLDDKFQKELQTIIEDYEKLQQENDKLKEQQKEFINYLENGIDICDGFLDTVKSNSQEIPYGVISASKTYITTRIKENETAHKVYEKILQKYKEIIGGE